MSNAIYRQSHTRVRRPVFSGVCGCRGNSAGYTLLEMLVTMLVIALLGTLVGPGFIDTINRNRQQSAVGNMFGMLSTARSEAVGQTVTVVACGSTDQATCNSNNWENGWIIFADDGSGGGTEDDFTLNGGEPLIRVGHEAGGSLTVRTRNFTINGVADAGKIAFNQDGFAESRGSIVVCDGDAAGAMALVLNLSGQARLAVDENADGFVNIDDASEVSSCP